MTWLTLGFHRTLQNPCLENHCPHANQHPKTVSLLSSYGTTLKSVPHYASGFIL